MFRVAMLVRTLGFIIIGESNCYADLTFHSSEFASKGEPNLKNQDREVFPLPNGLEFFVNRSPALRIAEKDIVFISIREAPTDQFLENTAKMAAKRRGETYEKRVLYEAVFRLTSSEAKRMREFATLNSGKTFAIKLRTLTISMPTFLGTFLQGDDFALVGVREEDIERISKMVPLLIKDQRPKPRKK
jgi:hypothetical protein